MAPKKRLCVFLREPPCLGVQSSPHTLPGGDNHAVRFWQQRCCHPVPQASSLVRLVLWSHPLIFWLQGVVVIKKKVHDVL